MKTVTDQTVKVEMTRDEAMKMFGSVVPADAKKISLIEKGGKFTLSYHTTKTDGEDPGVKAAEAKLDAVKNPTGK